MRKFEYLMSDWRFTLPGQETKTVDLPHTWNNLDGQDGGNDYLRTVAVYEKSFPAPEFNPEKQAVYLVFDGVNSQAEVELNGQALVSHEGGYSTFRKEITQLLTAENRLTVRVDNRPNDRVYPQKADFTFYGGIYRDVKLMILNKNHFDVEYFSGPGIQITPKPVNGYKDGQVNVKTWHSGCR